MQLLIDGYAENLVNPYSDIKNYTVESITAENAKKAASVRMLANLPSRVLPKSNSKDALVCNKTLFISALGGIDTTFYRGLQKNDTEFAKKFYAPRLYDIFDKHGVSHIIPRGFAAKKYNSQKYISNAESVILHAYHCGIRNVAIIANAKTFQAIEQYLHERLDAIKDLNIVVIPQPMLPAVSYDHSTARLDISGVQGGYPGGHGHGFKYCFKNDQIRRLVRDNDLKYFIFSNGDNSVIFNWGAAHFVRALEEMETLKHHPDFKNLRIAFFLVWENLRKGGFGFLLRHKQSGKRFSQIFEAELAGKSGADIERLRKIKGGYNTNVAVGLVDDVQDHLDVLPMVLKEKKKPGATDFIFEASLATAMTTHQQKDGSSLFDPNASIHILGPKDAKYQHWIHIAIRKRDDLFAFHSSLFKSKMLQMPYGEFPVIITDRDARKKYPTLSGNFIDPDLLNTKEFFEIFADAFMDVDDFRGTLCIDFVENETSPRGTLKFSGHVKLVGDGNILIIVPAGKVLEIRDKIYISKRAEG
ncbi:MAG: hypothetical protein GWP06_11405 [Actinobacteria bacterium]|nr:hypothetical protein [Actinomycetota bacterium]